MRTPMEKSAPSTAMGRKSAAPAVRWHVSRFPPVAYGGIIECGMGVRGATPISPAKGRSAMHAVFASSIHAYPPMPVASS